MVHFLCPFCGFALEAPDDRRGTPVGCPKCEKRFKVPSGRKKLAAANQPAQPEPAEDSFILAELDEDPHEDGGTRNKGGSGQLLGGGAFLLLLLLLYVGLRTGLLWRWIVNPLQGALHSLGVPGWLAPVVAVVILAAVAVPVALGLFGRWIKSRLLAGMPTEMEFLPATPAEFADLDTVSLGRYTRALEALGFRHALDYRPRNELSQNSSGFGRLFLHPGDLCYAEVNQAFTREGTKAGMGCNILSILEEGWSLSSSDRDPAALRMIWLWRQPRVLWSRHPGATPVDILNAHMERRDQLTDDLGLRARPDPSAQAYFDHEQAACGLRKRALERKNPLICLYEYWQQGRRPASEWLGEYRRRARKPRPA